MEPLQKSVHRQRHDEMDALQRWCVPLVSVAWLQFIVYEAIVGYDRLYSPQPLCPYSEKDFGWSEGYFDVNCASLGGFVLLFLAMSIKVCTVEPSKARAVLLTALNIVAMGMVANYLAVAFKWGGFCVDSLGVPSPAAIWGEWIAGGPLLIFITVTVVDKPTLTQVDWVMIVAFWLCIVFGFLIILPHNVAIGRFWLFLSWLAYAPTFYLPFYKMGAPSANGTGAAQALELFELQIMGERFATQRDLSICLSLMLPTFPIFYALSCYDLITPLTCVSLYHAFSAATKGLFVAVAMEMRTDLLTKFEIREEQRANEARRAFMKYLFHEVRTPLNSLTMGIDMLKLSENLMPAEREYLDVMAGATEFMSDTLNNVLNLHKIEEGKLELEQMPFSVAESVNKVLMALKSMINDKRIQLLKSYAVDLPDQVVGDRFRMEHVVSNLLHNACKFSPDGGVVVVSVRCDRVYGKTPSGASCVDVTFVVTDHGPGISLEAQGMLFRNIAQIRPRTLRAGQGSGLGLALCKAIVDLHGGTIGVRSEAGRGSSFSFTIRYPVVSVARHDGAVDEEAADNRAMLLDTTPARTYGTATQPAGVTTAPPPPPPPPPAPPAVGGRLQVLVVDDADTNRKMLTALVGRLGLGEVHADVAEDGRVALHMVTADLDKYKLVFMDNLMPHMNGLQSSASMRQAGFPYIIAGVTGNVMEEDVAEYLHAGADVVLGKPVRIDSLKKLVALISRDGPQSRYPGQTIVDRGDRMEWVAAPRRQGKHAV